MAVLTVMLARDVWCKLVNADEKYLEKHTVNVLVHNNTWDHKVRKSKTPRKTQ